MSKISATRNFFFKNCRSLCSWFKEKSTNLDNIINRYKKSHSYTKNWDKTALVKKASATLKKVNPKKIMDSPKSKWIKPTMILGKGLLAHSTASHILNVSLYKPAILRNFGSPLHLAKAASRVINKYQSSIRKGIKTTTGIVQASNPALYMSKNAINHYRY